MKTTLAMEGHVGQAFTDSGLFCSHNYWKSLGNTDPLVLKAWSTRKKNFFALNLFFSTLFYFLYCF